MTAKTDRDFRAQLAGFSLTTAEILYRLPDHPSLLQSFIWQEYDLHPRFPRLRTFLDFWTRNLEGKLYPRDGGAQEADHAGRAAPGRRRLPPALTRCRVLRDGLPRPESRYAPAQRQRDAPAASHGPSRPAAWHHAPHRLLDRGGDGGQARARNGADPADARAAADSCSAPCAP